VELLRALPPTIAPEVASGHLEIVGAEYHLHAGEVTILH
jgi:hypothetical protein